MNEDALSRRSFLRRAGVVGAAAAGATVLVACGGGSTSSGGDAAGESGAASEGGDAASSGLNCNDTAALTETEITTRNSLQYVEASEKDGQNCTNCQQYEEAGEGACGTCLVVPGTINPAGWCSVWVEKTA